MARLQVVIGLLAAVLVFVTGGSEVARADPDVVLAGHDLLETAGETYMDFSANPLPVNFFGPGSDPFDGVIYLEGNPFDSFGGYEGLSPTDTIIRRNEDAGIPEFPDTIEIEIVALELKSVEPITVSFWGGTEFYDYDVTVSVPEGDEEQETGSMIIRHEGADGGTFDIPALPVRPLLTFTPVGPGETIGPVYYPEPPASSLLVFEEAYDEPWCHTANPLDVPPDQVVIEKPGLTSNFFPGIACGPPRTKGLVVLDALFPARHSVKAAEKQIATTVQAGHDLLETAGDTYIDFSLDPLPADFFGPGSDPFDGVIALEGVPFDSFGGYEGLSPTDTIVRRHEDAGIPGFPDTIEIEIVALELKSVEPITVSWYGGTEFYEYDVTVSVPEGDTEQETGSMTIRHEYADGGTFDIPALPVRPLLTFTPLAGPGETIGPAYFPEPPASSLLVFAVSDEPWCHTANPLDVPPDQVVIEKPGLTSNFFPGIVCGPPRTKSLVVLDAPFPASLSVKSAENPIPPVGGIAALPDVSDSSGRSYVALAALAAAAVVALATGGWYARRRLS